MDCPPGASSVADNKPQSHRKRGARHVIERGLQRVSFVVHSVLRPARVCTSHLQVRGEGWNRALSEFCLSLRIRIAGCLAYGSTTDTIGSERAQKFRCRGRRAATRGTACPRPDRRNAGDTARAPRRYAVPAGCVCHARRASPRHDGDASQGHLGQADGDHHGRSRPGPRRYLVLRRVSIVAVRPWPAVGHTALGTSSNVAQEERTSR